MKKKMWGALALSAALATGTAMPAFALDAAVTPGADVDGNGDFTLQGEKNTGSTDVKVLAEVTQLNATLPMEVTVVANMQGGQLLASPTGNLTGNAGEGYRIENRTIMPLKLVDVQAAAGSDDKWIYADSAITNVADYGGADKLGKINLTILNDTDDIATATTNGKVISSSAATALGFSVPAGTVAGTNDPVTPGKLGLKLGGTTSYINSDEEIATADGTAVKLTYTIAIDQQTGA